MGNFVQHEPCPECGSSDGLARYDDNSAHCFACKEYNEKGDGQPVTAMTDDTTGKPWTAVEGHYQALPQLALKEETLKHWRYQVGKLEDGTPCHIMESRRDGKLTGQKFRTPETKGMWRGDAKNPPPYGMWLWAAGGKYLTITEGEKDALSMSQANGLKFAVVSLPNGTGSVKQMIKGWYDYINSFENIVLMFDQDEPGQKAVEDALELLPAGKVKVAKLPHKDANDTLVAEGPGALVKAFWDAEIWRPDGIVDGSLFTRERVKKAVSAGFSLRYPKLQAMSLGLRKGEITMLTAGSGIGKSTWLRQLAYENKVDHGCSWGNVFLEENNDKTVQGYVALHNRVPLGQLRHNPNVLTDEQWDVALRDIVHKGMSFYDHFGSLDSANLITKMAYMAKVLKVDFIALDHVSIVTSGIESSSEGERKDIDILMTRMRSLCEETGVGIVPIVHLKRKQGTSYNEGGQISLNDLRGSGSLEQLSDNVWALERDQQAEDGKRDISQIRVLKGRETGETGEGDALTYNRKNGWLEVASPFEATSPFDPHSSSDDDIPF